MPASPFDIAPQQGAIAPPTQAPDRRQQLDGIVMQMAQQKAPQAAVQAVVQDFTTKYAQQPAAPQPAPEGVGGIGGVGIGAAKGAGSTLDTISRFGQNVLGQTAGRLTNLVTGHGFTPVKAEGLNKDLITPKGTAEKIGYTGEQIGEFLLPTGLEGQAGKFAEGSKYVSELPKFGKSLVTASAKGLTSAAETYVRSKAQGQSNDDSATNAFISGLSPVLGKALEPVVKPITTKLASRNLNSLIKPKELDFAFGKNPGLAVAEEGLTANTQQGLLKQITGRKQNIGQAMEQALTQPEVATKVQDITPALKPIDQAINTAVGRGEQELVDRLLQFRNGLTEDYQLVDGKLVSQGSKNLSLAPKEIQALKTNVGEGTRWTGQAFDKDLNQVKVKVYQELNNMVEHAAPGSKVLNQRYANLLTAEKALQKRIGVATRNDLVGLKDMGFGAGALGTILATHGGAIPAMAGAVVGAGISKAAGSTAVKSRLGKALVNESKLLPVIPKVFFGTRPKAPQN